MRTVADDILISGEGDTVQKAVKDHDKKLLTLLETCREKGVKLREAHHSVEDDINTLRRPGVN